jgi:preprotein translocase subunit SecA
MRRFAGERVAGIMDRLRMPEDVPIEAGMVTKAIERAQRTVEAQNFEIRKNVLKYDEIMNRQREVIYEWRRELLAQEAEELVNEWIDKVAEDTVVEVLGEDTSPAEWDWEALNTELSQFYPSHLDRERFGDRMSLEQVVEAVVADARAAYAEREKELGADLLRQVERSVVLSVVDNKWREHLSDMDYLRAGIGLRAMGQRDPLVEYQREGYEMFSELVEAVKRDTVRYLFRVQLAQAQPPAARPAKPATPAQPQPGSVAAADKVGRNDPCPCGSGKKYKRCHGAV